MKYISIILIAKLCLLLFSCHENDFNNVKNITYWNNYQVKKTKFEIEKSDNYSIYIKKGEHVLYLYKNLAIIRQYHVNLRNELPDRYLESDGQTPEGIFTIYQIEKVTKNNWQIWIGLETIDKAKQIYINENSSGKLIIDYYENKYGKILNDFDIRKFNKVYFNIPMLRGFGIHGGGYRPEKDWTIGCIALDNNDIIDLYSYLIENKNNGIGTKVYIQD